MKTYAMILFASAGLLSSFSSFAQQDLHKQSVGTIVKSQFTVAKKNVFLPDGDWTLIGVSETDIRQSGGGRPSDLKFGNMWLAQTQGKSLRALVRVQASLDAWAITRWTGKSACDRTDVVFAKDQSRYVDDHFCYVINHRVNVLTGTGTGFGREAYLWLEQRGIKVPGTMITVEYHRSAIPGNALYIWYYFNPEYDGFSPSTDSAWSRNEWHKDFINRDVKKVAYVDALKSWATAMAPVVDKGFRGEKVEPEAYPKWPSVP